MCEMLVLFLYTCAWVGAVILCYTYVHTYIILENCIIAAILLLTAAFAYVIYPWFRKIFGFHARVDASGRAVLITGCDTGFGHELAKRLASKGFHVFAACLSDTSDGALTLKKSTDGKLRIIKMDVRKDEDVKNAVAYVKSNIGDSRFWAVVNNAGIVKGLDIPLSDTQDFIACLETNTIGVVRVTKAFLPLLMESKGRVVTVTSVLSRLSIPHIGAYCMSKFATRAFSEILRQEIQPWGVKVIEIQPEYYRTAIATERSLYSILEEKLKYLDDDMRKNYDKIYFEKLQESFSRTSRLSSPRISKVVDDLEKAVSLMRPKTVYQPCRNIFIYIFFLFVQIVPKNVLDLSIRLIERVTSVPPTYKKI